MNKYSVGDKAYWIEDGMEGTIAFVHLDNLYSVQWNDGEFGADCPERDLIDRPFSIRTTN